MKVRLLLFVTSALFVCASLHAADIKVLEKKLDDRYNKQKVNIVVPGRIFLAPYAGTFGAPTDIAFQVHIDHFSKGVEIPKNYQKRDELDERTTQEVSSNAKRFISELTAGEQLEVLNVRLFKRGGDVYMVDLMLKSVATNRRVSLGVHFRFVLPIDPVENGDFDAIVREINPYIVPTAEYREAQAAQKNIDIQPGMTREEIVKAIGEPLKSITFGKKTTLTYKEVIIELEDGKVVNVKSN